MRIFAFTDVHGNRNAIAAIKRRVARDRPDVVCCCGDLSVFGHELGKLLAEIAAFRVPVLVVHGNHENQDEMRELCTRHKNLLFLHKQRAKIAGWTFLGFGGGGFSSTYPELEAQMKRWKDEDWERCVVLSHAPPYGTKLDDLGETRAEEWHVGSKTLTKLVKSYAPALVLAGHIHECFHAQDALGRTRLINPGPGGTLITMED